MLVVLYSNRSGVTWVELLRMVLSTLGLAWLGLTLVGLRGMGPTSLGSRRLGIDGLTWLATNMSSIPGSGGSWQSNKPRNNTQDTGAKPSSPRSGLAWIAWIDLGFIEVVCLESKWTWIGVDAVDSIYQQHGWSPTQIRGNGGAKQRIPEENLGNRKQNKGFQNKTWDAGSDTEDFRSKSGKQEAKHAGIFLFYLPREDISCICPTRGYFFS